MTNPAMAATAHLLPVSPGRPHRLLFPNPLPSSFSASLPSAYSPSLGDGEMGVIGVTKGAHTMSQAELTSSAKTGVYLPSGAQ